VRALVLWADDRSPNLGVRALAHGSAALVRRAFPDAEVDLQNFGKGAAPVPIGGPKPLLREHVTGRHGLRNWLAGYDLVVDTRSGDSFADIYGQQRLVAMTLLSDLAVRAGVPVVLGPQTIGPFDTRRGRAIAKHTLRRASVVMARDHVSADGARALGREPDVLTTDVVFALPVPTVERTRDVLLNVSGLLWNPGPHVDAGGYRATVEQLIEALVAEGRHVTLLAHVLSSPGSSASPSAGTDDDVAVVTEIAHRHAGVDVVVPTGLTEVREAVASARLVIGSRMHACLNALSVGTPAIPLAYSRKFEPLLDDLGWRATVDLRTSTDHVDDVMRLAADDTLLAGVGAVRERAEAALGPAEAALRKLG
jgi:polysaccharide pyruvyl transferase WcaK-like protein